MATVAPLPLYSSILQLDEKCKPLPRWTLSKDYAISFQQSLVPPVQASGTLLTPITLTGQAASIPLTPMPLPSLAPGPYRVSTYARVTVADAVSSSLTVTLGWTETGLALTHSFAAMTGNTTATVDSQTWLIEIDQASPISYATTYASGTPGAMHYRLTLIVEAL